MKTYWEQVLAYLEKYGKITNQEIIKITNTNCPHSVIRDVKKHGVKLSWKIENSNGKKYKVYYFDGFERKLSVQVKTPITEIPSTETQLSFDLGILPKLKESESERRNRMLKTFGYC